MYVAAPSLSGVPDTMSTGETVAVYTGIAAACLLTVWVLYQPKRECAKLHGRYCEAARLSDRDSMSYIRARAGASSLRCNWLDSPSCRMGGR
jgi:hypothetical protein